MPKSLGPLAAVRQLFASPLAERVMARHAARLIPQAEREIATLGRAFGETSVGLGAGVDGADGAPPERQSR